MSSIKVTNFHGIIIKKDAIASKSINIEEILKALESSPLDESNDLISFGPSFGKEAADEFIKRLEKLGLDYVEDFYVFEGDFPEWISFRVELN
ncbi:MAG: hypothetical protein ISR65_08905 [Bacteriovoracaceae bacterium]|nr:hypothetical protein [Bacteriovoracaceae bacterium]